MVVRRVAVRAAARMEISIMRDGSGFELTGCEWWGGDSLYTRTTMMKNLGSPRAARIAVGLVCFLILMLGVCTLFQGNVGYRNWWGGVVFAPFAIFVGGLGLFIAGFRPKFF